MKTEKVEHTALPWSFASITGDNFIMARRDGEPSRMTIAVVLEHDAILPQEEADANKAFIVRACNNAQRLADAAAYALKAYDNGYDDDEIELTMIGIREALADWSRE